MIATAYRTAVDVNNAMLRVYNYMAVAMLISFAIAWGVSVTPSLMALLFGTWFKWVVMFAPLVFILGMSFMMRAEDGISKSTAQLMLYGFAGLMGLSTAIFFAVFTSTSIVMAFMGTVVLFGTMSFYGYFTKRSLDSLGQFMIVGLIAIIIASIINIFVGSSVATMVISAIAIIIFLGLTAYDTQKIREMISYESSPSVEIMGALSLYMDFINIFLNLLQLFGERK